VWGNTIIEASRIPEVESSVHHNVYQSYGGAGRKSFVYNNFVKNVSGGATYLWYPSNTTQFYAFNNVVHTDSNLVIQLGNTELTSSTNSAGFFLWNNSFQSVSTNNWAIINGAASGYLVDTLFVKNNHLIASNKTINSGVYAPVLSASNNQFHTVTEANALSYTAANNLAPTSISSVTVGAGTAIDAGILDDLVDTGPSTPTTAVLYDTPLGVSIDTVNHIVLGNFRTPVSRGGSLDIGAYQYHSTKTGLITIVR
jgi:UDP-N-acetylglucosamine transferase subunit ALG13